MVFLVTLFIVYWLMYDDIMETGTVFMSLGLIMSLKKNLMTFSSQLTAVGKVRTFHVCQKLTVIGLQILWENFAIYNACLCYADV